jgi:hypothetical protein
MLVRPLVSGCAKRNRVGLTRGLTKNLTAFLNDCVTKDHGKLWLKSLHAEVLQALCNAILVRFAADIGYKPL